MSLDQLAFTGNLPGVGVGATFERCAPISAAERQRFIEAGVIPEMIDGDACDPILVDKIVSDHRGRFEFAADVTAPHQHFRAFILLARDAIGDPVDLVAWRPDQRELWPWRGRAWGLGQENCLGSRTSSALTVFRDPLEWLKADRAGVVVIDGERAASDLVAAEPVVAADPADFEFLRRWITPRAPKLMRAA
jgi:hypothetical protein